ncbi:hypothetical protein EVG20_g1285 [Dentipellis fragilis]|uniref:Uncharacterized protein n=1 Tax=Dentipellis fragilis TaxID=205917 RepID=A0A4Y9ZC41_9AGAM|nr:hypothetical protein EVG20_g1285 [Dentipellis fragilis]
MQANLCDQCGKRPKFVDGTRVHNYCGKTCAAAAAAGTPAATAAAKPAPAAAQPVNNASTTSGGSADLCIVCGKRPKYNDGVKTHDFCGKTCAAKGRSGNAPSAVNLPAAAAAPAPANASAATNTSAAANAAGAAPGGADLCKVCHKRPRYNDGKKVHEFCGKTCAAKA